MKQVHLTEAGRAKCWEAEAFMDRDQDWLLQGFTEQEKQQFYQYLKRVEQNVQNKWDCEKNSTVPFLCAGQGQSLITNH